jgi:hypothetical protein
MGEPTTPRSQIDEDGAGPVALALAALVPTMSVEGATDLKRLLGHSISLPSPAELREARLGLLIDLVENGSGEVPSVEAYEGVRSKRRDEGETWPAATTLIHAYGGHWLAAVRSAMRVAFESRRRVPSDYAHARLRASYTREECLAAFVASSEALGSEPSMQEYLEWAALTRRLNRLSGRPDPRLPGRKQIMKAWGTYERLLAALRRRG